MSTLTTLIQHCTRNSSHSNQTTKRNKRHPNWKGKSRTVIICRQYDSVHRKPCISTRKVFDLINEFGKVARYKVNIQKFIVFLQTNNELSEKETRGEMACTIATIKIKYLGINLTKEVKDLYLENYKTLKKKLRKIQINGSIYCLHRFEELTLQCP